MEVSGNVWQLMSLCGTRGKCVAVHGNVWHWNGSVWHYIEMCGSSRNRVAAHGKCVEEDVVCVSRLKYVVLY